MNRCEATWSNGQSPRLVRRALYELANFRTAFSSQQKNMQKLKTIITTLFLVLCSFGPKEELLNPKMKFRLAQVPAFQQAKWSFLQRPFQNISGEHAPGPASELALRVRKWPAATKLPHASSLASHASSNWPRI